LSKSLHEYTLDIRGTFIFDVPKGSCVLSTLAQGGKPTIWVEVPDTKETQKITLQVISTGDIVPEGWHIGTCSSYNGKIISHVYLICTR